MCEKLNEKKKEKKKSHIQSGIDYHAYDSLDIL